MGSVLLSPQALAATALAVFGALALLPLWLHVSKLWWSDPLRVIGAAFPPVALLGVLGAWRRLGWSMKGSVWGLVPIVVAAQLAKFVNIATSFQISDGQYWRGVHPGLVLFLYAAGTALLFGGWPLVRRAILPLCLLLCVNPVPRFFNVYFDLPLQELSAGTARAFAHLIGLHPTGEQLRMMFAPDFGMLIVPGCNGVRGSITFAYLALIYGYTRHLRLRRLLGVSAAALLIGYGMNLLRLCVLVIYYRVGLSVPFIQDYGAQVDYVIGCTVFLTGTMGLGFLIRSLEPAALDEAAVEVPAQSGGTSKFAWRAACFVAVTMVPIVQARALFSPTLWRPVDEAQVMRSLPAAVGPYRLVRSYSEQQYADGGAPMLVMGEYAAADGTTGLPDRVTMGLYVASGFHREIDSKAIRGVYPMWKGSLDAMSAAQRVSLGTSAYNDGTSLQFYAEGICTEAGCDNPLAQYQRFRASDYFGETAAQRLPIMLRIERPDSAASDPELYAQFAQEMRQFLQGLDVKALVARVGRPLD